MITVNILHEFVNGEAFCSTLCHFFCNGNCRLDMQDEHRQPRKGNAFSEPCRPGVYHMTPCLHSEHPKPPKSQVYRTHFTIAAEITLLPRPDGSYQLGLDFGDVTVTSIPPTDAPTSR